LRKKWIVIRILNPQVLLPTKTNNSQNYHPIWQSTHENSGLQMQGIALAVKVSSMVVAVVSTVVRAHVSAASAELVVQQLPTTTTVDRHPAV
jgi:hypothetical protein